MDRPIVELLDGDALPDALDHLDASDAPMLMLVISRREVEMFNIGSVVNRLMILSDTRARTRRLVNSVYLVMEGWDHDSRELYCIPECVRFVRAMAAEWNGWLHFMDIDDDNLGVLLRMLLDIEPVFTADGQAYIALRNPEQAPPVIEHLKHGLRTLYATYEFSDAELASRLDEGDRAIARVLGQ